MATNLSLDPKLIERALQVSGERTKNAAVTRALEDFIARRRQKRLVEFLASSNGTAHSTIRPNATASELARRHQRLVACSAARRGLQRDDD